MTKRAFSLIEVLILLAIIAILTTLAIPTIRGALASAQRSQLLSNSKQVYATLIRAEGEGENLWPSTNSFNDWANKLTPRISTNDAKSIFGGAGVTVTTWPPDKSSLLVYEINSYSNEDYILVSSHNWNASAPAALEPNASPFGDSGFVFITKGGRGGIGYQKDATNGVTAQPAPLQGNPAP